jgi:hypothetical protein
LSSLSPAPQPNAPLARRLTQYSLVDRKRSFTAWNELCNGPQTKTRSSNRCIRSSHE